MLGRLRREQTEMRDSAVTIRTQRLEWEVWVFPGLVEVANGAEDLVANGAEVMHRFCNITTLLLEVPHHFTVPKMNDLGASTDR